MVFDYATMRKMKHKFEEKQQIVSLVSHPYQQGSLVARVNFLLEFDPFSAILLITFECSSLLRQLFYTIHNSARIAWKVHLGRQCYVFPLLESKNNKNFITMKKLFHCFRIFINFSPYFWISNSVLYLRQLL